VSGQREGGRDGENKVAGLKEQWVGVGTAGDRCGLIPPPGRGLGWARRTWVGDGASQGSTRRGGGVHVRRVRGQARVIIFSSEEARG